MDEFLWTNVPHIFAAGDVIDDEMESQMATPVSSQDGGIAAHNALSREGMRRVNHRVIPRAIFTDPQIGLVGLTEEEAVAASHPCWCNTLPMALVPRADGGDFPDAVSRLCAPPGGRGAARGHGGLLSEVEAVGASPLRSTSIHVQAAGGHAQTERSCG